MSNPFAINSLNSYTQSASAVSNPYIGSRSTGTGSIYTPAETGATGTATGAKTQSEDLNEVALIGSQKAEGFKNGLGGTNNPDDHQLFLTA